MSQDPRTLSSMFTQVDIGAGNQPVQPQSSGSEQTDVLREILAAQDRNNALLEELVRAMSTSQKQRASELSQWKQANPELAQSCRKAAEALSRVQIEYLDDITEEITDSVECLMGGEFMLNEFIDRFGPRLAHLNGMIQVLAQLSSVPNPTGATQQ